MTAAIFEKTWTVRASAAKAAQRAGLAKGSYTIAECNGEFAILELEDKAAAEMEAQVLKDCGQDDGAAGLDGGIDEPAPIERFSVEDMKPSFADFAAKKLAEAAAKPIIPTPMTDKQIVAQAFTLPTPPDFSKPSHAPYRKRLALMVAAAEAGDAAYLAALTFKVERSSQKIMARYRDACLKALGA